MKLCSACLLGIKCRYDGKSKPNDKIIELAKKEILIPFCPEQLGGQATPRPDAEIKNGTGNDVLEGNATVIEPDNNDVTEYFINGANECRDRNRLRKTTWLSNAHTMMVLTALRILDSMGHAPSRT